MLLNPALNNTISFKLDIGGSDSLPECRIILPMNEADLMIKGTISEGMVSFDIPAFKGMIEKGTKQLQNVVLEAIIEDQYFKLNEFEIDLKEEFTIAVSAPEEIKPEKVVNKPRIMTDIEDVKVQESETGSIGKLFSLNK